MTNYSELIIGEWNYTSQILNGNDITFDDECQKDFEYAIYSVNGVFNQTEFENRFGNGCVQVDSSTGTWKIENSAITLTVEGDTTAGTILSVNIFLASAPVFDNIPTLESLVIVAVFTPSQELINENPERLIFK